MVNLKRIIGLSLITICILTILLIRVSNTRLTSFELLIKYIYLWNILIVFLAIGRKLTK